MKMAKACSWAVFLLSSQLWLYANAIYVPVRQYAGSDFFEAWDYQGTIDNTTWGNVTYVDRNTGITQGLTYVDTNSGNAIIRVDNTTNIPAAPLVHRNSVRITSKDSYPLGSLVVIDAVHVPYGCSVWPSFWTLGAGVEWPHAGEIDIIESINLLNQNQMALHTDPGCFLATNTAQTGRTLETDCSTGQGCLVQETKPNSFGSGFAQAGGGAFALQFDVAGIFMWFWPRSNLPSSIFHATASSEMDLTDWGTPTAAYPASACNMSKYFGPQQLVIDITLCGVWAGVPDIYASTCPGQCINNVIGSGNPVYNTAYWEISYIRTYLAQAGNTSTSMTSSDTRTSTLATVLNSIGTTSTGSLSAATTPSPTSTNSSRRNSLVLGMMNVNVGAVGIVVMLVTWFSFGL